MSETENPKLDDMTFTDAAECCLELGRSLMVWRGDTYNLKDDRDIQRGIARQKGIVREREADGGQLGRPGANKPMGDTLPPRAIPPWVADDLAKENACLRAALRRITTTIIVSECQAIARKALGE